MINVQGKTIDELFQEADDILKQSADEATQEKINLWKNGCKRPAKQEILKMETLMENQPAQIEDKTQEKVYVPQKTFNLKNILLGLGLGLLIALPLFFLLNHQGETKYVNVYLDRPIYASNHR